MGSAECADPPPFHFGVTSKPVPFAGASRPSAVMVARKENFLHERGEIDSIQNVPQQPEQL